MNRRQIALKLVLQELGLPLELETFDQRLILQKAIYLLQQADVPLGYHYSWYLKGPYSPDVTSDAYESIGAKVPEGWALGPENKNKISEFKKFIQPIIYSAWEMEKLASILYIIKMKQALSDNIEGITERMIKAGKIVTQDEVRTAVDSLKNNNLV